jgi:DNA-binding NarL/FixJ family response regulator
MVETGSIRVILADDHEVVRAGIREFLERAPDIEVVAEASDGTAAQELILRYRPDVAVLDIQMPGVTGIEVARWARDHAPEVGVLILTAFDDYPYVRAVTKAGAAGYVLKTASHEDLVRAVREVAAGRPVLDLTIMRQLASRILGTDGGPVYERPTDRELEVLTLAGRGLTNRAIGRALGISERTVQGHLIQACQKLQASGRTAAVMRAVALGLLPADLAAGAP